MNNIMPPINTPDNAFHDGNPATGEQGTIVPGLWLNNSQGATRNIQQEIISVLAEAEIEIDETKDNQLLTAILSLITASIPDLPVASLTQAGIVKLISSLTSDSESLAATAKAVKLVANAIVTSMSDHIQTANPHHQYLAIANFLSEIKDVGPAAVAQTLLNLGLGDAAQRTIGTGSENVPDITAADKRYLKQSGGTVVGDAAPIIIRAATLNAALYLLAQQSDGSGAWYLGMPVAENNRLVLRSYANNCEISLSSGRGDITVPLYIEGGKAYYPGNKPPLTNVWVSGEYTPVMATPTVVNHGLAGIDVLHCKADVLLKCVTADAGYSPGDFAAGWSIHSSANAATVAFPALSSTTIQTNTGAAGTGLLVNGKGGGGSYSAVLANWRYILRIFY